MELLHIAFLNVKKRKRDSISLLLLVFIASFILNLGVKNVIATKNQLLLKVKETDAVENTIILRESVFKEAYLDYFKADPRVSDVKAEKILCMPSGYLKHNDENTKTPFLFLDESTNLSFEHITIDPKESKLELAVYVPMYLQNYGFQVNDPLEIHSNTVTYTFHIAGFYETTLYGISTAGGLKLIASEQTMEFLREELDTAVMIGLKCYDIEDSRAVQDDFLTYGMLGAETGNSFDTIMDNSFQDNDEAYSFKVSIVSLLTTAFSAVIFILVLLVIRVRISNHIEDHLADLGTMQALGYTKLQLQMIYTFEYLITAVTAVLAGTTAAYISNPFMNHQLQMTSGLVYQTRFGPGIDLVCLAGITCCVILMSMRSSSQVKKYPPVAAFRKGRKAHDFKKNYFDLCKGHGSFHARIAAKSVISAIKQHILVVCCIAGVTFAAVFGAIMFDCFVNDPDTLKRITGMEFADIGVEIQKSAELAPIREHIEKMEGVDHTLTYDVEQVLSGSSKLYGYVCSDYTRVRTINCYEGTFPKYEDEVVITGVLAEKLGKKIGDMVDINQGGYCASYMITGFMQTMTYGGQIVMMTPEGIARIKPNFEPHTIYVYLKDGKKIEDSIAELNKTFGTTVTDLTIKGAEDKDSEQYAKIKQEAEKRISLLLSNYDVQNIDYSLYIDGVTITGSSKKYEIRQIDNIWSLVMSEVLVLQKITRTMMMGITAAIVCIVAIILSLVIRTMIIHRKEEFGIYKAIGYTSIQLREQIAISMLPSIVLGALIGSIAACFGINPLSSSLFHATGISCIQMTVNPLLIAVIVVLITLFSFGIAMLSANKVKKISVYELLKE